MKKTFLFLFLASLFLAPQAASAINLGADLTKRAATKAGYAEGTNETTLASTIGQVIKVTLSFIGILFTVLMVYSGFLWMTARGEESQIEKAKKIITYSIIGIIVSLGSYSITAFILPRVLEITTGENVGTLGSPNVQVDVDTEEE